MNFEGLMLSPTEEKSTQLTNGAILSSRKESEILLDQSRDPNFYAVQRTDIRTLTIPDSSTSVEFSMTTRNHLLYYVVSPTEYSISVCQDEGQFPRTVEYHKPVIQNIGEILFSEISRYMINTFGVSYTGSEHPLHLHAPSAQIIALELQRLDARNASDIEKLSLFRTIFSNWVKNYNTAQLQTVGGPMNISEFLDLN